MRVILAFMVLTLSAMSLSCRSDKPPVISIICTLDGLGGGDCVQSDGTRVYKLPSEMKNMWATTQTDEANFAAWCYKVPTPVASNALAQIKDRIDGRSAER